MKTLSEICFNRFMSDLAAGKCPQSLTEQKHKLKIESVLHNKPLKDFLNLETFRRLFTINDTTKIIAQYKTPVKAELQTIFLKKQFNHKTF
jgi:hypothetical protein